MEVLYGPPGTGKTTELLRTVEQAIKTGVAPEQIGYVSFTTKATREATARACEQFALPEDRFLYFRTLHSMAFRQLALNRGRVMQREHYKELGTALGLRLSGGVSYEAADLGGEAKGDLLLFIENMARLSGQSLQLMWQKHATLVQWYELERFATAYRMYKEKNGVVDFTDMINMFVEHKPAPKLKLLVVDEAQDLSTTQWQMVDILRANSEHTIIAGDDDQAIFAWAGADITRFISLGEGGRVLGTSYRVPRRVQRLADSVIGRVRNRKVKQWAARADEGVVAYHRSLDGIDFSKGKWLILARNTCLLAPATAHLRRLGHTYAQRGTHSIPQDTLTSIRAWETMRNGKPLGPKEADCVLRHIKAVKKNSGVFDKQSMVLPEDFRRLGLDIKRIWHEALDVISLEERVYIISALKHGEKITQAPRIRLSTIHGEKGGEEENVVLYTDVTTRTYDNYIGAERENESRVFYVGITRARQALHVILPQTPKHFPLDIHNS